MLGSTYLGYILRQKPTPRTTFVNRFCGTCNAVTRSTGDNCHVCKKAPPPTPSA